MILKLLVVLSYFLNAMPRGFRRALGASLGWFWFHILRFRRSVVEENLRLAFGEEKSEAELQTLARRNFRHYAMTLVEITQSVTWKKEDYEKNVPCEGIENMRAAIAQGKGVYGLTCHLGNWEWVIGAVMSRGVPGDVVVKRSKSPGLDAFLLNYRQNMGIGIFYESGVAKDILRSISKGRLVGFILDQFMGPPIGLPVRFFGKQAGTAIGLALLTDKKEAPIVPIYSYRNADDRLVAVVDPALEMPSFSENREDRLYEKTQFYNDVLEERIRRHPEQWIWMHRRWKTYRGEPRWKPSVGDVFASIAKQTLPLACLLGFLSGCVSSLNVEETPTGIAIPADPIVGLPETSEAPVGIPAEPAVKDKRGKKKIPLPTPTVKVNKFNPTVFKPEQIPFEVGERMTISLDWTAIPAGTVRLEVKEGLGFQGRNTFKIWGNVLSSPVVDAVYHVDNTIESYIDKQLLLPYKFLLHMVETHQLKETRVAFDHKVNQAHYWSQRISKKWGDEVQDRVDTILPSAHDMFSALYYARVLDYQLGVAREIPIYENRQNLVATLTPVANEIVQTKAGVFQCWKMSLTLKIDNVLKPSGDLFLWLSDDWKKYIVKFDAKLKIGSLRGELTSVRERQ